MGVLSSDPRHVPAVYRPSSLLEAWKMKRQLGDDALYAAGGTLLRTQWEAGTAGVPQTLIDLRGIEGVTGIIADEGECFIGALTDLSLCRKSPVLKALAPQLQEAVRAVAAPSVRNLATIGGNIACGYGDTLPALLVLDADLELYDGVCLVRMPVSSWLSERWGDMQGRRQDAILTGIRISSVADAEDTLRLTAYRKVGRRETFTPSLVTAALAGSLRSDGTLERVRLAAGGGSGCPQRLKQAEVLLEGNCQSAQLLSQVYDAVQTEFEPVADAFAGTAYRKRTAGNLIAAELWRLFSKLPG